MSQKLHENTRRFSADQRRKRRVWTAEAEIAAEKAGRKPREYKPSVVTRVSIKGRLKAQKSFSRTYGAKRCRTKSR